MKQLIILTLALISFAACNQKRPTSSNEAAKPCCSNHAIKARTVSVDDVFSNPDAFIGKEILLEGLCIHTCRNGGKKMFLQGTDEENVLLITAGESISSFGLQLEGSQVEVIGVIVGTSHAHEHDHEHAEGHSCVNDSKTANLQMECSEYKVII